MKRIYIDVFDCSIYAYKSGEEKRYKKDYDIELGADQYGSSFGNGVFISDKLPKGKKDIIGVIYHEAVHATDWILEDRLMLTQGKLGDNQELRAYLVEYIGDKIREYCCE